MAARYSSTRQEPNAPKGQFTIGQAANGWTTVNYKLSEERLQRSKEPEAVALAATGGFELMRIEKGKDVLTMFPINTLPDKPDFLLPRYGTIRSISLEGFDIAEPPSPEDVVAMLEELPAGFIKDPEYGLGLQKDFRFIIYAIGLIATVSKLVVSKLRSSSIDGDTYVLNYRDFEAVRKGINRVHSQALADADVNKRNLAHNALLTARLPKAYPEKHKPYKPDTIFQAVTAGAGVSPKLSTADQKAALALVSANRRDLSKSHPQELLDLRREIELVTLEQLIQRLEKMIVARHGEGHWQRLFLDNPFILSLAFGLPIVSIHGHVSVGGRKFDGTGDKIADFLHRNELTDNVTLMEIKAPAATLLGAEYRGGVFAPSTELASSVTQALDQRYQLQKNIAGLKDNSKQYDLESYAVKCVIVIGTTPEEPNRRKSFELFRNNLNDVLVITFDELLAKLRHLHTFLSPT